MPNAGIADNAARKYCANLKHLSGRHCSNTLTVMWHFNMKILRQNIFILTLFLVLTACSTKQAIVPFKDGNKYGFKSLYGKIIIEPKYDGVGWDFYNGFMSVKNNGKWGFINEKGDIITEIKYDYVGDFSKDGIATAELNGLFGFINKTGKEIIPFIYENTWGFQNGIAKVKKNNLWGFIDTKGDIIIPIEYEDFKYSKWSEGLIGACKNHKWGFIDKTNKIIIPFGYYDVGTFSEGLALAAESYYKWGYIDHNDTAIIPFIYENPKYCDQNAGNFKNGIAQVRLEDKSGYINKKGEIIIPIKYHCVKQFCKGYAYAEIDNGESNFGNKHKILLYGYIDSIGNEYLYDYPNFNNYNWHITAAPKEIPDSSYLLKSWDTTQTRPWTIEKLLAHGLDAFREEPTSYPDLCTINEICVSYGLMLGGGNFGEDFIYPNKETWNYFKENTIYKVISSELLRQIVWNWIAPYYKNSFQSLNPFAQKTYKNIAVYLRNYINRYDKNKVEVYLKKDEKKFAYFDMNGNYDPNRKLSAFVDRLIIIHKVITVDEAKTWINKIADEVVTW